MKEFFALVGIVVLFLLAVSTCVRYPTKQGYKNIIESDYVNNN